MGRQSGQIVDLTFAWQRIDRVISGLSGEYVTPKEIQEITGVDIVNIRGFLCEKTKKKFLERTRRGCYRKVSNGNLTQKLPEAFIATKVWEILCQSDKPLILREVSKIITENTGLDLYFSVSALLMRWHQRNVLDKFGGKQPYAYKIKQSYKNKDRPLASPPF